MNLWFIPVAFVLIGVSGVAVSMLRTRIMDIEKKMSELESKVSYLDTCYANLTAAVHREAVINDNCHGVLSVDIHDLRKAVEELKQPPRAEVLGKGAE